MFRRSIHLLVGLGAAAVNVPRRADLVAILADNFHSLVESEVKVNAKLLYSIDTKLVASYYFYYSHLDRFSRFCTAHPCTQHLDGQTDRQTDRQTNRQAGRQTDGQTTKCATCVAHLPTSSIAGDAS